MKSYEQALGGYKERILRIALFDLFNSLNSKQGKDERGRPLDYFGLCLLTLLFFFENMLTRNKKTGVKELALFLMEVTSGSIDLPPEEFVELARTLVSTMRPASGKRNRRDFMNYETREMDYVEYALLKAEFWDREANVQYYALDEQGLELVFATKEYYSEFQISIGQLILRKQLEKGEFAGALRQIDEMRINVNTMKDKMLKIKHEVIRNILSTETYERYKELIEDINRRLMREQDEFVELTEFIKTTKINLNSSLHNNSARAEHEALSMMVKIENELGDVHHLHSHLLKESIELKNSALQAAEESLYYVGVSAFNFDQEIVRKWMNGPLPFELGRKLANPLLPMGSACIWSPLTLFAKQRIEDPRENLSHISFLETEEETISEELKLMQRSYHYIFSQVLSIMGNRTTIELAEVVEKIEDKFLEVREFYDLFMIIHQRSPISVEELVKQKNHVLALALGALKGKYETLTVVECGEAIEVSEGFRTCNMQLTFNLEGGMEE